jgi:hypothetical protein
MLTRRRDDVPRSDQTRSHQKQRSLAMSEENGDAQPKKRVKKKNALKHGVYSREVMLPGENIRDYEALAAELMEEWAPEGPTERSLVDRLVELHWRRQRLVRYEHAKLQLRIEKIREDNQVSLAIQKLKDCAPEFEEATSLEEVDEILLQLSDTYIDHIEKKVPYDKSPDAPPRGPAIAEYLASIRSLDHLEGPAELIALVNPDAIENDMARLDRVDEAIDRTVKRLMQVKTAKQIFPNMRNAKAEPKVINVPAVTGPSAQGNENEQKVELLDKVEVFAKPNPSWSSVPTLRNVTKLGGGVELVAPGSLPNDGKVIADERG